MAEHIRYANGITVSPDGERIYVAACTDGSVLEFSRYPFQQTAHIDCGTGVDNLEWDQAGNLWSAGHPQMLAFMGHSKDAQKHSPCEVVQIQFREKEDAKVVRKYLNDGSAYSGSSIAIPYQGQVYLGSVFEKGIFRIPMVN